MHQCPAVYKAVSDSSSTPRVPQYGPSTQSVVSPSTQSPIPMRQQRFTYPTQTSNSRGLPGPSRHPQIPAGVSLQAHQPGLARQFAGHNSLPAQQVGLSQFVAGSSVTAPSQNCSQAPPHHRPGSSLQLRGTSVEAPCGPVRWKSSPAGSTDGLRMCHPGQDSHLDRLVGQEIQRIKKDYVCEKVTTPVLVVRTTSSSYTMPCASPLSNYSVVAKLPPGRRSEGQAPVSGHDVYGYPSEGTSDLRERGHCSVPCLRSLPKFEHPELTFPLPVPESPKTPTSTDAVSTADEQLDQDNITGAEHDTASEMGVVVSSRTSSIYGCSDNSDERTTTSGEVLHDFGETNTTHASAELHSHARIDDSNDEASSRAGSENGLPSRECHVASDDPDLGDTLSVGLESRTRFTEIQEVVRTAEPTAPSQVCVDACNLCIEPHVVAQGAEYVARLEIGSASGIRSTEFSVVDPDASKEVDSEGTTVVVEVQAVAMDAEPDAVSESDLVCGNRATHPHVVAKDVDCGESPGTGKFAGHSNRIEARSDTAQQPHEDHVLPPLWQDGDLPGDQPNDLDSCALTVTASVGWTPFSCLETVAKTGGGHFTQWFDRPNDGFDARPPRAVVPIIKGLQPLPTPCELEELVAPCPISTVTSLCSYTYTNSEVASDDIAPEAHEELDEMLRESADAGVSLEPHGVDHAVVAAVAQDSADVQTPSASRSGARSQETMDAFMMTPDGPSLQLSPYPGCESPVSPPHSCKLLRLDTRCDPTAEVRRRPSASPSKRWQEIGAHRVIMLSDETVAQSPSAAAKGTRCDFIRSPPEESPFTTPAPTTPVTCKYINATDPAEAFPSAMQTGGKFSWSTEAVADVLDVHCTSSDAVQQAREAHLASTCTDTPTRQTDHSPGARHLPVGCSSAPPRRAPRLGGNCHRTFSTQDQSDRG